MVQVPAPHRGCPARLRLRRGRGRKPWRPDRQRRGPCCAGLGSCPHPRLTGSGCPSSAYADAAPVCPGERGRCHEPVSDRYGEAAWRGDAFGHFGAREAVAALEARQVTEVKEQPRQDERLEPVGSCLAWSSKRAELAGWRAQVGAQRRRKHLQPCGVNFDCGDWQLRPDPGSTSSNFWASDVPFPALHHLDDLYRCQMIQVALGGSQRGVPELGLDDRHRDALPHQLERH